MKKKTTIQDIAQRCNVSPATVSRVLNRHAYVSEDVRLRVSAALEELNYKHSEFGLGYVAIIQTPGSANKCGLQTDAYSRLMCNSLSIELSNQGFRGIFVSLGDYDAIIDDRFCGIISLVPPAILNITDSRLPVIYINGFPERNNNIYQVCSNEAQGMELAVSHLVAHHHPRIGMLCVGENTMNTARTNAFIAAAKRHAVDFCYEIVPPGHDLFEQLGILMDKEITSLIVPGEEVGIKVTYALQLYQHRIPQDISIVTWEVHNISEYWYPRLTSVSQNYDELARNAVKILVQSRNNEHPKFQTLVQYSLIERNSVRTFQGKR